MTAHEAGALLLGSEPDQPSPAPVPQLELSIPRASIARLLRHPALDQGIPADTDGAPVGFTWHDTPDHALASQGRALCRHASGWTLEEIVGPGSRPTVPGEAARLLRSAATVDELGLSATAALGQIAGFTGTLHRAGSGSPDIEVLDGLVAASGEEHPVCRVRLRGMAPAEVARLAETLPLSVPLEPLPAFALRCAAGRAPCEPGRVHVGNGSLGHLAGVTIAGMTSSVVFWCARAERDGAADTEVVHQARVALRRLRSALRLLRPAVACPDLHAAEPELRETFVKLGACRDLDVFVQGVGAAVAGTLPDEPRLAALLLAAEQRRGRSWAEARRRLLSPAWRGALVRLAATLVLQPWVEAADEARRRVLDEDAEQYGARALRRARRRVLAASSLDGLTDEELHALRRRCKRLRYAAELFAPFYAMKPARRFLRRLARVQDAMGRVNDAAVAAQLASGLGRNRTFASGVVAGWTAADSLAARKELDRAWKRLRKADPFWE